MPRKKTILLDIDGVLYPYPKVFLEFASDHLQEYAPDLLVKPALTSIRLLMDIVGEDKFREIKKAYRASGLKAITPPFPGAREFVTNLFKEGFEVKLTTSRPEDNDKVRNDTRDWVVRFFPEELMEIWFKRAPSLFLEIVIEKDIDPKSVIMVNDRLEELLMFSKEGVDSIWFKDPGTQLILFHDHFNDYVSYQLPKLAATYQEAFDLIIDLDNK